MIITAYFTEAGNPKTGLTPTINGRDVGDGSLDINAQAMTEVGDGFYKYDFTTYDGSKEYVFVCDGGAGLANPERYAVGAPHF